ncbi:LysM peptidoglycan-binding domain-containing protein [Paenibacillus sp. N1-5-1-14]|uniref:LysM peptidoglycan-binding domain-containing protein n=1 Tax=Paenibacillus radicibacter TaxID=2972488 RepID=UPI0021593B83|nr:LysM domain-containing protein [Paenibacillus radicibacter]MCR8645587.1 LysM peptidoglycan-binding domain-containing protein [Paenibacillus radicibacter]
MEFWLSFNNGEEKLRLPVPPSSFEMQTGNTNETVNIYEVGEVQLIGKRRLKSISLASYFPIRDDGLCQYRDFPPPQKCVEMIEKWRDSGRPIRLIIIGESLTVNEAMAIESFNYSQKHGPQDIYFTLDLREYRFLNFKATTSAASALLQKIVGDARPVEKVPNKTYIVRTGDTLLTIAKSQNGDASAKDKLKEKNGIVDENNLTPGKVLVL